VAAAVVVIVIVGAVVVLASFAVLVQPECPPLQLVCCSVWFSLM
jgi:hypothetical protein